MSNPFKAIGRYFNRVLIGLDQFGNTLTGGYPDETISARVGRRMGKDPLAHVMADCLDAIQQDHVKKAILHERDGSQQAGAYKDVYDADDIAGYVVGVKAITKDPLPGEGQKSDSAAKK
jgi:hypothetical protein